MAAASLVLKLDVLIGIKIVIIIIIIIISELKIQKVIITYKQYLHQNCQVDSG